MMSQQSTEGGAENPYQSPGAEHQLESTSSFSAAERFPEAGGNAEQTRREYLAHEATVMTIGLVMYLRGAFVVLNSLATLYSPAWLNAIAKTTTNAPLSNRLKVAIFVIGGIGGLILWLLGSKLRQFKSWARWLIVGAFALGIFDQGRVVGTVFELGVSFPWALSVVSILINIYIIYVLLMQEDGTLFSIDYQDVLLRTPHMVPRMGLSDMFLVGVTVLTYAAGTVLQLLASQ